MGYVRSLQSKVCFLISKPPNSQFSNFSELLRCISKGWHCSTGERNVAMPREKTWQCQEPTETKIYSKPTQKKTSKIQICKLSGFNFFKQKKYQKERLPGNQCIKGGTIYASQVCQVSRRRIRSRATETTRDRTLLSNLLYQRGNSLSIQGPPPAGEVTCRS